MPIDAECKSCGRVMRLRDDLSGRKVRCPDCSEVIDVPDGSVAPPPRPSSKAGPKSQRKRSSQPPSGPANKPTRRPKRKVRQHDFEDDYDDFDDDWDDDDDWNDEPPVRRSRKSSATKFPAQRKKTSRKAKKKSSSSFPIIPFAIAGVALLTCSGAIWWVVSSVNEFRKVADIGDVDGPVAFSEIPLPQFPELGSPVRTFPSGVETFFVDLGAANSANAEPGFGMKMRVYRPAGDRPAGSVPCVLVAPAGTNLMVGNDMDADDYHDETLPYAESGMVTIFYSIDGGIDLENASDGQFASAYRKFRKARAGIVNGRNALEYALAKLPEVNPKQIYCAGHSSAGTLSLLLASHEDRIAGCIAYAPCSDVESFQAEVINNAGARALLPGIKDFAHQTSPINHAQRLKCPLFLFHANDDSVSPVGETAKFATMVGTAKDKVDFVRVPRGGHYQPMIDAGIPAAIEKIKQWSQ